MTVLVLAAAVGDARARVGRAGREAAGDRALEVLVGRAHAGVDDADDGPAAGREAREGPCVPRGGGVDDLQRPLAREERVVRDDGGVHAPVDLGVLDGGVVAERGGGRARAVLGADDARADAGDRADGAVDVGAVERVAALTGGRAVLELHDHGVARRRRCGDGGQDEDQRDGERHDPNRLGHRPAPFHGCCARLRATGAQQCRKLPHQRSDRAIVRRSSGRRNPVRTQDDGHERDERDARRQPGDPVGGQEELADERRDAQDERRLPETPPLERDVEEPARQQVQDRERDDVGDAERDPRPRDARAAGRAGAGRRRSRRARRTRPARCGS